VGNVSSPPITISGTLASLPSRACLTLSMRWPTSIRTPGNATLRPHATAMPLLNPELEHRRRLTPIVTHCKMLSLYRLCHHLVCSYPLLPPMIKQENR
jgi:hypothetical protein